MTRHFPLQAVLAIREQKEAAEERTLAAIAGQIAQRRAALALLDQEIRSVQALRANPVLAVTLAAEHQAAFARIQALREARQQMQLQIEALERGRLEQQARYIATRNDREMLNELLQKQIRAWELVERRAEQKRVDDLFNARRSRG